MRERKGNLFGFRSRLVLAHFHGFDLILAHVFGSFNVFGSFHVFGSFMFLALFIYLALFHSFGLTFMLVFYHSFGSFS